MSLIELFLTAIGLSMDAMAVSISKGLATGKVGWKHMITVGIWFGGFQGLMPLIGYYVASAFGEYICTYDHWIAFGLLALIGANMIREVFWGDEETSDNDFGVRTMLVMAIATSIDALATGVSYAVLPNVNIWFAIGSIGVVTFVLSAIGVKIGSVFGDKYSSKAQLAGGIILIAMGLKILITHLLGIE